MSPRHIKAAKALAAGKSEYEAALAAGWHENAAKAWVGGLRTFLTSIGLGPDSPAIKRTMPPASQGTTTAAPKAASDAGSTAGPPDPSPTTTGAKSASAPAPVTPKTD